MGSVGPRFARVISIARRCDSRGNPRNYASEPLDSIISERRNAQDGANDRLMAKLGLKFRYEPARLAIARSLELDDPPPPLQGEDSEEYGKTIPGRNLFGDEELALWIAMIIERANLVEPTSEAIQEQVRRHWHRGISCSPRNGRTARRSTNASSSRLRSEQDSCRRGERDGIGPRTTPPSPPSSVLSS